MKIKFRNLPDEYVNGTSIICKRLGIEERDVCIRVEMSESLEVGFESGEGYIKCSQKHQFFRMLGLFAQYYQGEDFCIKEKQKFETLSSMLCVSRGSAPTVKSFYEYLEQMAVMGFNQLQFYMEDTYEVKERPHFGYLRGRYTFEELKAIDDYAYDLGIEVVASMQTLGHLNSYLKWPEGGDVAENGAVLYPESEKTYEFIEQMIKSASAPFRSRKIHVGLDETAGLGLGRYLKEHGLVDPLKIFSKHVSKVTEICHKLGLKPMMWNDMFFCYASKNHQKYDKETVVPPEICAAIPEDMQLVYWNYEYLDAESYMIDKHFDMGQTDVMFAGGVWIWQGILPDNIYSGLHTERALKTCREKGVKEVMLTIWSYHSNLYQTALLEMQHYAELTYAEDSSKLKERFEFCTGASYEAFVRMSDFHALYSSGKDYDSLPYDERFAGTKIMWSDIMLGVLDHFLFNEPRSEHYARTAEFYKELIEKGGEWLDLYKLCLAVFEFMSVKCEIAEKLVPSYLNGDKETLKYLAENALPRLLQKTEDLHYYNSRHKETYLKPFGGEHEDHRYGGLKERCKYAQRRLEKYLNGEVDRLEELEEERLPFKIEAWGWGYENLSFIS